MAAKAAWPWNTEAAGLCAGRGQWAVRSEKCEVTAQRGSLRTDKKIADYRVEVQT
jgi:hypothetical protein